MSYQCSWWRQLVGLRLLFHPTDHTEEEREIQEGERQRFGGKGGREERGRGDWRKCGDGERRRNQGNRRERDGGKKDGELVDTEKKHFSENSHIV